MKRILLRAEVQCDGHAPFVAHTLELANDEAFIETDVQLAVNAEVLVRLSFPRLVEPFEVIGRVTSVTTSAAPGEPSGLELEIEPASPTDAERLHTVLTTVAEEPAADALAGFHVLLVEDNNLIRDMFSYGIRKYFRGKPGYVTVDHAADGASAWKMLAGASYDLAIVDYFLPELDGAQLVQRMKAEPRLANVPIVAVSVGGPTARDATLAAGADLFLDKPLVLKDLFATLERLNAHGAQR
ncbi:MAG: response regulator receiver modulated PilZ sensor protein [Myxococcales bacterium]|nr:response regulator receiver modulated PilZ sensor protein [Myxococcales bacterium]